MADEAEAKRAAADAEIARLKVLADVKRKPVTLKPASLFAPVPVVSAPSAPPPKALSLGGDSKGSVVIAPNGERLEGVTIDGDDEVLYTSAGGIKLFRLDSQKWRWKRVATGRVEIRRPRPLPPNTPNAKPPLTPPAGAVAAAALTQSTRLVLVSDRTKRNVIAFPSTYHQQPASFIVCVRSVSSLTLYWCGVVVVRSAL